MQHFMEIREGIEFLDSIPESNWQALCSCGFHGIVSYNLSNSRRSASQHYQKQHGGKPEFRKLPPNADKKTLHYIGNDVWISFYTGHAHRVEGADQSIGFIEQHYNPFGKWCMGSVMYDLPESQRYRTKRADGTLSAVWDLISREPLHIEPSVVCHAPSGHNGEICNHHGYIRDGLWIPV